jgi:hypothetical protein
MNSDLNCVVTSDSARPYPLGQAFSTSGTPISWFLLLSTKGLSLNKVHDFEYRFTMQPSFSWSYLA